MEQENSIIEDLPMFYKVQSGVRAVSPEAYRRNEEMLQKHLSGKTIPEIAEEFNLSEKTVFNCIGMHKNGVHVGEAEIKPLKKPKVTLKNRTENELYQKCKAELDVLKVKYDRLLQKHREAKALIEELTQKLEEDK